MHAVMIDKDHACRRDLTLATQSAKLHFAYNGVQALRSGNYVGNREIFTVVKDTSTGTILADNYHNYSTFQQNIPLSEEFDIVRSDGEDWQAGQELEVYHHVPGWDNSHALDILRIDITQAN